MAEEQVENAGEGAGGEESGASVGDWRAALPEEIRGCPKCGKRMIPWFTGMVRGAEPHLRRQWDWGCKCGHVVTGGTVWDVGSNKLFNKAWEAAQGSDKEIA